MLRPVDEEGICEAYVHMYDGMIAKDEAILQEVLDESFVLVHMTGMRQPKDSFIKAVMDGTLNYYSEQTDRLEIDIKGDMAIMTGRSRVSAAVFGGGRHTWRLALKFGVKRTDEGWKLTKAQASTW